MLYTVADLKASSIFSWCLPMFAWIGLQGDTVFGFSNEITVHFPQLTVHFPQRLHFAFPKSSHKTFIDNFGV